MQHGSSQRLMWQGAAFALLATLVWSGNFIVGRKLATTLSPASLAFYRWLTACVLVLPFAWRSLRADWQHYWQHWRFYCVCSFIGIAFFNTAIYFAAQTVPAINLTLMATTSPLFVLLLSRMLWGEPLSYQRMAGLCIVVLGVLLLLCKGDVQVLRSLSFGQGDVVMLGAAAAFAVYTLMLRHKPEGGSALSSLLVTFALGCLMLLPLFVWEGLHLGHIIVPWRADIVYYLLYLGAGPSLLAFWAWLRAVESIGPGRASVIYYTIPLFAGIEAVLFLGEPLLPVHYMSGVLIIAGLVVATRQATGLQRSR